MKISSRKQTALNETCRLIKITYGSDDIGNDTVISELMDEIYCGSFSTYENEFYDAALLGFRVEKGLVIYTEDDNGGEKVDYGGETYDVYRRFDRGDGYTEVYLREDMNE